MSEKIKLDKYPDPPKSMAEACSIILEENNRLKTANSRLQAEVEKLNGLLEIAIPYVEERFGTVDKLLRNPKLQQFYIQEYTILKEWLEDGAIAARRKE